MKSELTAKFLQHLNSKKKDGGFTLIELLVVIIIIGILSAIALPSFLNQANKAKQSEAKTYVGSMNRAQQAFYLEKNAFVTVADDFGKLGLGVATQTTNYSYTTVDGGAKPVGVVNLANTVVANAPLKPYAGGVAVGNISATSEATTLAALCESDKAMSGGGAAAAVGSITFVQDKVPACAAGFTAIK